jgi:hypothetical protein
VLRQKCTNESGEKQLKKDGKISGLNEKGPVVFPSDLHFGNVPCFASVVVALKE